MANDESDDVYLRVCAGFLKVLEAVSLLICTASVGYYLDNKKERNFDGRKTIEFFVVASVMAGTVVVLFILIWLFEIHKRTTTVLCAMAIIMVIASSLLADFDKDCDDNSEEKSRCSQITAGVVFGFFAFIMFTVDALVHCCRAIVQSDEESNENRS